MITADGIALESLFLNRSIPFAQVESISVKVIDAEEPGVERLTVRGSDGQKIALDSSTPCYRSVLGLLRSRRRRQAPWLGRGRPGLRLKRKGSGPYFTAFFACLEVLRVLTPFFPATVERPHHIQYWSLLTTSPPAIVVSF